MPTIHDCSTQLEEIARILTKDYELSRHSDERYFTGELIRRWYIDRELQISDSSMTPVLTEQLKSPVEYVYSEQLRDEAFRGRSASASGIIKNPTLGVNMRNTGEYLLVEFEIIGPDQRFKLSSPASILKPEYGAFIASIPCLRITSDEKNVGIRRLEIAPK